MIAVEKASANFEKAKTAAAQAEREYAQNPTAPAWKNVETSRSAAERASVDLDLARTAESNAADRDQVAKRETAEAELHALEQHINAWPNRVLSILEGGVNHLHSAVTEFRKSREVMRSTVADVRRARALAEIAEVRTQHIKPPTEIILRMMVRAMIDASVGDLPAWTETGLPHIKDPNRPDYDEAVKIIEKARRQ